MHTDDRGQGTQIAKAAPVARWHIRQWQCVVPGAGQIRYLTAPQRQPPARVCMALLQVIGLAP